MTIGLLFHYEGDSDFVDMSCWEAIPLNFGMVPLCVDLSEDQRWTPRDNTFESMYKAQEQFLDHTWVYLAGEKNIPEDASYQWLHDFEHPDDNVIYVVGPDYSTPLSDGSPSYDISKIRKQDKIVNIRNPREPNFAMWGITAAAAVVYDRWYKIGYDKKWPQQS